MERVRMLTSRCELITPRSVWGLTAVARRCWWGRLRSEVDAKRVFGCGELPVGDDGGYMVECAATSAVFHRINVTGKRRLRFNYCANLRFNRACAALQWDGRGIARIPPFPRGWARNGLEKWLAKSSRWNYHRLLSLSLSVVQISTIVFKSDQTSCRANFYLPRASVIFGFPLKRLLFLPSARTDRAPTFDVCQSRDLNFLSRTRRRARAALVAETRSYVDKLLAEISVCPLFRPTRRPQSRIGFPRPPKR